VPLAAALYLHLLARRRRSARRYARLATVAETASTARRHVPAVLLLLGLASLIFAIARPSAVIMLPSRVETIMLAIDASGSMRATDVKPDRITAAQTAAKTFIEDQPGHVRIGVVAVAGAAAVVQAPTDSRDELVQAIDRFQLQRGTALGSGLVMSLATLLPTGTIDVGKLLNPKGAQPAERGLGNTPAPKAGRPPGAEAKAAAPGSNRAAAIVLLSDGVSNVGPDPIEMAQVAADHGVRVFTVGIGTADGATPTAEPPITIGARLRRRISLTPSLTSGRYQTGLKESALSRFLTDKPT